MLGGANVVVSAKLGFRTALVPLVGMVCYGARNGQGIVRYRFEISYNLQWNGSVGDALGGAQLLLYLDLHLRRLFNKSPIVHGYACIAWVVWSSGVSRVVCVSPHHSIAADRVVVLSGGGR